MVLAFRSSAKKTRSNLDMSKDVWATDITVTAIHGFPLVSPGCDVVEVTLFCLSKHCLLYTSDAADDSLRVDLGGRRII